MTFYVRVYEGSVKCPPFLRSLLRVSNVYGLLHSIRASSLNDDGLFLLG